MSRRLTDKVVIITGASSGIGAGIAVEFAKEGSKVVLVGRNVENLEKTSKLCQDQGLEKQKILTVKTDVTDEEQLARLVDATVKQFGGIDVLVNNAGAVNTGGIQDVELKQLDEMLNIHVRAVFQLTKLAIPYLVENRGSIVNVSSLQALSPGTMEFVDVTYSVAKAGLDMLTKCTALELAKKKVRCNSVNPGVVPSGLLTKSGEFTEEEVKGFYESQVSAHPLGKLGTTEDVAKAVTFLASEDSGFITGAILPIDGGRNLPIP
ncbi:unnamed protein product [Owenia fusiformis]|uniref:Uncharacterized protein n=1 Tax=Owenia fusiformis TaxID=6347 RepID=A0A8J1XKG7_OWEFU|nr:unnamed protein product [Owenia fusiformis]